jgi:hypothetical protein
MYRIHVQATYDNHPVIPVTLRNGSTTVECQALIDSGATYNLFHASLAHTLGVDGTNGRKRQFTGISDKIINGYEATIEIRIGDMFYPVPVYFSDDLNPNAKNMLGQIGFFDRFTVEFEGKTVLVKEKHIGIPHPSLASPSPSPLVLGTNIETGQLVSLEQKNRLGSSYVIGKAGSGKTTLLVNMILQDIENGNGLCFLDPHEDAITEILKRVPPGREQDIILLDMLDPDYAFGLNLFRCENIHNKQEVSRVTSMVMGVFAKLFTESGDLLKDAPNMAETLQNAVPVLLSHQNPHMTMAEMPLLFLHEDARAKLIKPITNSQVQLFWNTYNRWKRDEQEALTGSTRRRVGNFLTDPFILEIIGQSETTLPFRNIIDRKKILLVKLSRQHELISNLIGSIIVGQIAQAAFSRVDTPEENRVPFFLYVDEFQNFATSTFAQILAETRKFRVFPVVAHQWRGQLDKQNREATLTAAHLIVFQVTGEDAEELAKQFDCTPPPAELRREEKLTPVNNPIDRLVAGQTHPNPLVNEFMVEWTLDNLIENSKQDDYYGSPNEIVVEPSEVVFHPSHVHPDKTGVTGLIYTLHLKAWEEEERKAIEDARQRTAKKRAEQTEKNRIHKEEAQSKLSLFNSYLFQIMRNNNPFVPLPLTLFLDNMLTDGWKKMSLLKLDVGLFSRHYLGVLIYPSPGSIRYEKAQELYKSFWTVQNEDSLTAAFDAYEQLAKSYLRDELYQSAMKFQEYEFGSHFP